MMYSALILSNGFKFQFLLLSAHSFDVARSIKFRVEQKHHETTTLIIVVKISNPSICIITYSGPHGEYVRHSKILNPSGQ